VAEPRELTTAEPEHLEDARRNARFTYAQRRIRKIVDGWPPLTPAQREALAQLLRPYAGIGNGQGS
jgi:hypothetical protein